jgi:type III secretory pathway component EscS
MSKLFSAISGLTGLALIGVIVAAVAGWIINIVELVTQYDTMPLVELVLRIVGVFIAILGAGMGLFA